jgi:hypothetical protein
MIKKTVAVLMICLCAFSSVAQDRIIHMGKDTIRCVIREIGDTEIKYNKEGFKPDLIFGIDKNQVSEIIFADGRKIKFKDSMHDPVFYANQRKNAIKFGFLSPLFNATSFSYERSLGIAHSIEGTIGIIGLGYNDYSSVDAKGAYLKIGYKLIKSPDFYLKGMHYAHILKGGYIKPEINLSAYHYQSGDIAYTTYHNTMFAFLLNFGKQWILEDSFLVDLFGGIGYGFGKNEGGDGMHYAFVGSEEGNPFAFSAGLKIGFLIK